MKKITLTCLSFLFLMKLNAQQIPQYSLWNFNQLAINPAHAGIKKCIDVHALFRAQWVGIQGAPKSGVLTAGIPLRSKRKRYLSARHGLGFKFETDQVGQLGTNRVNVAYAGHFNFNKNNRLSLGVYGGVVQFGYNHASSTTIDHDPVVMHEVSIVRPDAHFGAWWNGKNYYIGLMANQLIPSKWGIGYDSQFRFHLAFNGGYRFLLNNQFGLVVASMVRMPFVGPVNADLMLNLDYNSVFNVGVGLRTQDALIFNAGFKINKQFSLQYSFDLTISQLRGISNNTHEISISFITCKPERNNSSACPLFQ